MYFLLGSTGTGTVLSCPVHVAGLPVNDLVNKLGNLLVFERERLKRLKRLKKYIHVPYTCIHVAYVAYAREKFWNMPCVHAMYMYIV